LTRTTGIVRYGFLTLALIFFVFPLFWIFLSSFKTEEMMFEIPPVWFFQPNFGNYWSLITGGFRQNLLNSLIVASSSVAISVCLAIPAAYALARFDFRAKPNVTFYVASVQMAPAFGFIVPYYILVRTLGFLDTLAAVATIYLTFNLGFAIWMLKGHIESVPNDLEESAMIDGCSRLSAIVRVVLPVIKPGLAATIMLMFAFSWNEFIYAFILTSHEATTVTAAIAAQLGTFKILWTYMCAMSVISIIPPLIVMYIAGKYIVAGLTLGGVKG